MSKAPRPAAAASTAPRPAVPRLAAVAPQPAGAPQFPVSRPVAVHHR